MKNQLLIILLLFCLQTSVAQNFEIGGEVGYGKSLYNDHLNFKELFGTSTVDNFKLGIDLSLKPDVTDMLVFNTGFLYQRKGNSGPALNFFKIPLGLNFEPGKKLRFIIGGGIYVTYLFMTSGSISSEITNYKSDVQFGSYLDTGLKYYITPSWSIFFQCQLDFDLSSLYKEPIPEQSGETAYTNIRSYDYTVSFGFKYLIPRKNK